MSEEKPWADGFKRADGAFSRKLDRVRSTQTGLPAAGGKVREWNSGVFTARTLDGPTKPPSTSSSQSFPIIPNNANRSHFNLPAQPVSSPYELAPEYTAAQGPYQPVQATNQPAQPSYQAIPAPYQPTSAAHQQAPAPHQQVLAPNQQAPAPQQQAHHQPPLATVPSPQEPYAAQAPFPSPPRGYEQGPAFLQPESPRPTSSLAPVPVPMIATNSASATHATPAIPTIPATQNPTSPSPGSGNPGQPSVQSSDSLDSNGVFDAQTQTYSFKYMVSRIQQELIRSQYFQRQAAVFVVAIDILQAAPSTWGQKEKDRVLQAVSLSLINSVRPVDLVGRFAEERFFILCPEITFDSSKELAETLRAACSATKVKHEWQDIPLSVSIGIAVSSDQVADIETLLAEADVGADLAMQNGGNQFYCY